MKKKGTLAEQVRQMQEDARQYDDGYSDGYDIANSLKYFINFEGQSPDFNRGFTGGFNDGRLDTPALWEKESQDNQDYKQGYEIGNHAGEIVKLVFNLKTAQQPDISKQKQDKQEQSQDKQLSRDYIKGFDAGFYEGRKPGGWLQETSSQDLDMESLSPEEQADLIEEFADMMSEKGDIEMDMLKAKPAEPAKTEPELTEEEINKAFDELTGSETVEVKDIFE